MKKLLFLWMALLVAAPSLPALPAYAAVQLDRPVVYAPDSSGLHPNRYTLTTPDHDLLRAGVAWYGKCYPNQTAAVQSAEYWRRAKETGLNAIRVTNWDERSFAGHYDDEPGYASCTGIYPEQDGAWTIAENLTALDVMVQNAVDAGMYIIITPGDTPGTHSKSYLQSFWGGTSHDGAAARYADNKNVVFEISNEPVAWTPSDYSATDLQDLAVVYNDMRTDAPNTPILSLSFSHANESMTGKVATFTNKVNALTPNSLDWSAGKDVVSFHTYGTTNMSDIFELQDHVNHYPVMNTEWGYPGSGGVVTLAGKTYNGETLERSDISWMNFQAGRGDGQFTSAYFDFVNDAKAKGYYWLHGADYTDLNDALDDWSLVSDKSLNMQFAAGNPSYFNGDTSRVTRNDTKPGYIVYHAAGIGSFRATIYSHDNFAGIIFYGSRNGADWEPVTAAHTAPAATSNGWESAVYTPSGGLPGGMDYLKIELTSTTANYIAQIGGVELENWSAVREVEDTLTAWGVADSHSANMTFATAGPSNFHGDASRAVRSDTNPGYMIYRLSDFGGFYAHLYYRYAGDVQFYSSADGSSWSPVAVVTSNIAATSGGWTEIYYENAGPLPNGAEYVKVEFTSAAAANATALSNIIFWSQY
ncbi:MAG: cellulase family glycosylhydrolase [Paenibacillaceae bacterium]|nr:cellulase family glycosylhydrolase [Paenibacillaceae bacterium]